MNKIRALREELRMTQVRLSTELGVAQETISGYETGRTYPKADKLIKMSGLFHASIDYILGLSDVRLPYKYDALPEGDAKCLSIYRTLSKAQKETAIIYMQGLLDSSRCE